MVIAVLLLQVDQDIVPRLPWLDGLYISIDSARDVLGVIAGAVLSIAGVVFSIVMVALTLTSGQYGPKVIRQFLGDQGAKVTLGLFIGTSLYCLVVIAGLGPDDRPATTVIAGLILTSVALASFMRFIHQTATSLQADRIIEGICTELGQSLVQLPQREQFRNRSNDTLPWRRRARSRSPTVIGANCSGYVQSLDYAAIVAWCSEHDAVCLLPLRAGDLLLPGADFAKLYGFAQRDGDPAIDALLCHIQSGPMRTPVQDPEYAITQLRQLAARALSPGINDPDTAITCIDGFTLAVVNIADRELPGRVFLDTQGQARVLARLADFRSIVDAFYIPMRQLAVGNVQVLCALYDSLIMLSQRTTIPERLDHLADLGGAMEDALRMERLIDTDMAGLRQRQRKLATVTSRLANL